MKKFNKYDIENSIQSEIDLFRLILESTATKYIHNIEIINAISSQSSIAKYSNNDLKIKSFSLNTHKLYIKNYSSLTYNQYNNLRLKALSKLITTPKDRNNKLKELEDINKKLTINNFILVKIIYDLKSTISNLAKNTNNSDIIEEVNLKLKSFEKILSYTNETNAYE